MQFQQCKLPHHAFYEKLRKTGLLELVQFNLSDACAETYSLNELQSLFEEDELCKDAPLTYANIQGDPSLRQSISDFHGQENPDHYVTFCGAQEALFTCMAALLKAGDEVITLTPAYPPLLQTPLLFGAQVQSIPLTAENHWKIPIEEIEKSITKRTKLIIVNQPHNPTGSMIEKREIERLWSCVENSNRYLIADEVSVHTTFNTKPVDSLYRSLPNIIGVGVSSKSLGLAGIRIGWLMVSNEHLREKVLDIKSYLSICCSRIDEHYLKHALLHSKKILARNNQLVSENINLFSNCCDRLSDQIQWHPPKAGLLSLVAINQEKQADRFSETLIQEAGIMLLPAHYLGLPGNYFRIGLGKKAFKDHLPNFERVLAQH